MKVRRVAIGASKVVHVEGFGGAAKTCCGRALWGARYLPEGTVIDPRLLCLLCERSLAAEARREDALARAVGR